MNEKEKIQEAEYRRGYQDGYLIALDNVAKMMFAVHISPEEAVDACRAHAEERLLRWTLEEPTKLVIAPEPKLWQPESQYDQPSGVPAEPQLHNLSNLLKQKEA